MFLVTLLSVISTVIVICIATPIFIIVIVPLALLYGLVQVISMLMFLVVVVFV